MNKPEYNTARDPLSIREYGRNVHKLIEQAKQLDDRRLRTRMAYHIVTIMAQINPDIKDTPEQRQKLWDHLFIMANCDLDVDAPYPVPDKEKIFSKPEKMPYPQSRIKFRYYGKHIQNLINQAILMPPGEEKDAFVNSIASYMKLSYLQYNDEKVSDDVILRHVSELSNGKLTPKSLKTLFSPSDLKVKQAASKKQPSRQAKSKGQQNQPGKGQQSKKRSKKK